MNKKYPIEIPINKIKDFCHRWKIKEFAFFGSVTREDFNQKESDIDVLITFFPNHHWAWEIVTMKEELEEIFTRSVDLVTKRSVENSINPYRKKSILESYEVIYEQAA
jgi:predicted nucleotidyltransferase